VSDTSILIRLRRVTTEAGYVFVPLTDAVLDSDPENPTQRKINRQKAVEIAIEESRRQTIRWERDGEVIVEPHPIQKMPGRSEPVM
jgi:hypothetical protein